MTRIALPGVVSAAEIRRTAEYIASQQTPSGMIPWFTGDHADPWDHVEAAMALSACGLLAEARRAYEWSAGTQRDDGSWPMSVTWVDGRARVDDAGTDANQCAYLAVGVWHHWLASGDRAFAARMWPSVRAAVDIVCDLQQPGGAISWSRDAAGETDPVALLTGSACMLLSLRCGLALADLVGDARLDWELTAGRLAHAVAVHPEVCADKGRFSMDWYYPVLGGAVRGGAAERLLAARWDEFVVPGRGVRCVADRPWVTAAETCELVLALDAIGDRARATRILRDIQFLRQDDGGYWTGWVFPEETVWPVEKSTWTAAAVVLATDAVSETTPAHGLFRGVHLPPVWELGGCDEHCYAPVQ